jgi:acyl-CoA synthetase (NDP forming)
VSAGLDPLFAPRTLAVLGVSRDPAKLGHRLLQNVKLSGFAGDVFPVNPSGERILGYPTVSAVEALPEGLDLALVSLPAPAVPAAIKTLGARRTRTAVVLSSGFGEVDDGGRSTQAALLSAARESGLRLVGPNCMGVYSAPVRLNGTYFWDLPSLAGGISIVSQSGAYGGLIFRHLGSRGLGVARFLSIGNQADVDVAEVIEWLVDDPATTLIGCFVESPRDGRRFVAAAQRARGRKPVVVLKGGRSDAGRRAAGSHTGALVGSYAIFQAACARAGAVLAEETEEFFDAIETLTVAGEARPAAARVAVITVSGGPAVVAADCAERSGLGVPPLAETTRSGLRTLLPPFAAVGNPVDLTPQVAHANIAPAVRLIFEEPDIAGAVAVNIGLDIPEFADAIVAAAQASDKPAVAFVADAPTVAQRLRAGRVPVLASPERAIRAWRALWQARARRPDRSLPGIVLTTDLRQVLAASRGPLPYGLARRVLEASGLRFCREMMAATTEAAVDAANRLGFPVVLKADAPGLLHKDEVGGVRLGLTDARAVREACEDFRARLGDVRFLVQEQIGRGTELLLGARRDESFGPVVVLGAGGVLTETIRDVALRLAPVPEAEAQEMLEEGTTRRLLAGGHGRAAVEGAALAEAVMALGRLVASEPRIQEVELNPLIAAGRDLVAVDALLIVGDAHAE